MHPQCTAQLNLAVLGPPRRPLVLGPLPEEVTEVIFSFLGPKDAQLASMVCGGWKDALNDDALARTITKNADPHIDHLPLQSWAAAMGYLDVVQWAHGLGCPWDESTCSSAAEGGHLHVLEWVRGQGCPWSEGTFMSAAFGGHMNVLKWLKDHGAQWNPQTCSIAALAGNLRVLQWLRSHKHPCPWDGHTCANAAYGGHLNVLEWAWSNGCPWDVLTCLFAAMNGHLEVLMWARGKGCPFQSDQILEIAQEHGFADIVAWVRSLEPDGAGEV